MNKYIFLTHYINATTPLYGGQNTPIIQKDKDMSKGDSANTSNLVLSNHTGTHVDFPYHFSLEGKTINGYMAADFVFHDPFLLNLDAHANQIIDLKNELTCLPEKTDLLMLKTGFEAYRQTEDYWKNNPGLLPELAEKLKNQCPGLRAVGMDFISVSSFNNRKLGREAHKQFLLIHDLLLIEDMKLCEMTSQPKEVTIAPLMIDKIDGAPVTVIAQL